ncbi:hypothetical protein ACG04Q_20765 [Roseateles sp. DXS20W]|uniref:Uncharacterized protein n=1 Tax=Pelomonas lactea TaxID=3299030 RepID=A0ABW7GPX0_9BURK
MLTMLGLIAAVWALLPNNARLGFRLRLTWVDWCVISGVLLTIHAFYFEPVLRDVGVFPVLGPWKWGFDKSTTQYLLFLLLAVFVPIRALTTRRLTRRRLSIFNRLSTSLLHECRFDELAVLLDRHLVPAIDVAMSEGVRNRVAQFIQPPRPAFQVLMRDDGTLTLGNVGELGWIARAWFWARETLADLIGPSESLRNRARIIVKRLLTSRQLVAYLATARPYLCLQVMERATLLVEEFQDEFFDALLGNEGSIFYIELKDNQNFVGGQGHRLYIPDENRLLNFYLKDVELAGKLGVYRSVGEAVLAHIDGDEALLKKLNGPQLQYRETTKHRCPVYAGIWFFRVMVLEGLHQRSNDHLWLHYMPHFATRLVERAREVDELDGDDEFPTPLSYLLYQLVATTAEWIDDAEHLTGEEKNVVTPDQTDGNHVYISFQAAEALGRVMQPILLSDRVTSRVQEQLLTSALHMLRRLEQQDHLSALAASVRTHLIYPYGPGHCEEYLPLLKACFQAQDHVLRADLPTFRLELDEALEGAQ